ncbi:MAG: uroporphyrinogen-III C-methyltransferase [Frankia sp.]|nr:uroporphyrinogen-III C-methyltransferase [Frankia sp.]
MRAVARARPGGSAPRGRGHVWLVGAGPGDPGLITVRGAELLASADVVVADAGVSEQLLALARPGAEILRVGPGARLRGQPEVNAALVEHALAGARVVRLAVGDPYLLGRGGEESAACAAADIAVTVVPGVSAALAGPAYAGIPVTHRGLAEEVAIVAGHRSPGHPGSTVDWASLGSPARTVVIMMGVAHLVAIVDALLAAGREPTTPVAVVERATTPHQRVLRTTLDALAVDAVAAGIRSPAVIVVGDVAARVDARGTASPRRPGPLWSPRQPTAGPADEGGSPRAGLTGPASAPRDQPGRGGPAGAGHPDGSPGRLVVPARAPAGEGPLAGIRVLVPRTRDRPGMLARDLRHQGAQPVETVVSRLAPVPDPQPLLDALPGADALVLADADEVAAVVSLLRAAGRDVRALAGLTLVAAAESAAAALEALGLATVRSSAAVRVAHVTVTEIPVPGLRVAVCATAAPPMGVRTVRRVTLATDVPAEPDPAVAQGLADGGLHVVAFASSTAVRMTAELYGPLPARLLVAAMGRRTAEACGRVGIRVDQVAAEPGIAGLVAAVCRAVATAWPDGTGPRSANGQP